MKGFSRARTLRCVRSPSYANRAALLLQRSLRSRSSPLSLSHTHSLSLPPSLSLTHTRTHTHTHASRRPRRVGSKRQWIASLDHRGIALSAKALVLILHTRSATCSSSTLARTSVCCSSSANGQLKSVLLSSAAVLRRDVRVHIWSVCWVCARAPTLSSAVR